MDSAKLNDWMQVVGIFALVASLVFVGLQLRQEREIALGAQFQQRVNAALDLWISNDDSEYDILHYGNSFIDDPDYDGVLGDAATPELFGHAYISARKVFLLLENHHYQYTSGFYDEATWETFRRHTENYLAGNRFARAMVRHHTWLFHPDFLELCEQILAELDLDSVPSRSHLVP